MYDELCMSQAKLDYTVIYLIDWCDGSKVQFPLFRSCFMASCSPTISNLYSSKKEKVQSPSPLSVYCSDSGRFERKSAAKPVKLLVWYLLLNSSSCKCTRSAINPLNKVPQAPW